MRFSISSSFSTRWYLCFTEASVLTSCPISSSSSLKRSLGEMSDPSSPFSAKSSVNTRFAYVLNSSSTKSSFRAFWSGSDQVSFSSSNSTGTSSMMVASCFERIPCSAKFSTFSFCLPFSLSVFSRRFSSESNSLISLVAVFSPMPGIPGMLSEASPHSPRMSITCSGLFNPYLSHISFTPNIWALFPM